MHSNLEGIEASPVFAEFMTWQIQTLYYNVEKNGGKNENWKRKIQYFPSSCLWFSTSAMTIDSSTSIFTVYCQFIHLSAANHYVQAFFVGKKLPACCSRLVIFFFNVFHTPVCVLSPRPPNRVNGCEWRQAINTVGWELAMAAGFTASTHAVCRLRSAFLRIDAQARECARAAVVKPHVNECFLPPLPPPPHPVPLSCF